MTGQSKIRLPNDARTTKCFSLKCSADLYVSPSMNHPNIDMPGWTYPTQRLHHHRGGRWISLVATKLSFEAFFILLFQPSANMSCHPPNRTQHLRCIQKWSVGVWFSSFRKPEATFVVSRKGQENAPTRSMTSYFWQSGQSVSARHWLMWNGCS